MEKNLKIKTLRNVLNILKDPNVFTNIMGEEIKRNLNILEYSNDELSNIILDNNIQNIYSPSTEFYFYINSFEQLNILHGILNNNMNFSMLLPIFTHDQLQNHSRHIICQTNFNRKYLLPPNINKFVVFCVKVNSYDTLKIPSTNLISELIKYRPYYNIPKKFNDNDFFSFFLINEKNISIDKILYDFDVSDIYNNLFLSLTELIRRRRIWNIAKIIRELKQKNINEQIQILDKIMQFVQTQDSLKTYYNKISKNKI